MKKCNKCFIEKDISLFYNDKKNPDGKFYYCKECCSKQEKSKYCKKATDKDKFILNKSGIYFIKIIGYNKIYIGSSINIFNRKQRHLSLLRKNKHPNKHLQKLYNENGYDYFVFGILELCKPDKSLLIHKEQFYINSFGFENIINICKIAGYYNSNRPLSEEDIKNIFFLATKIGYKEISNIYNVSVSTISSIINRKTYSEVVIDKKIEILSKEKAQSRLSKKFSEEEIKYLKENYPILGSKQCSIVLNRDRKTICSFAFKNGIKFNRTLYKNKYKGA